MRSDWELIGAWNRDRSEAAFVEIVRRHGAMVYRSCLRVLGRAHAAEDAAQATFMVLAEKSRSLRKGVDLACWLHVVARRAALMAARRAARRARREEEAAMLEARQEPGGCGARQIEVREELDRELARLPHRERQAVILRYLEDRSEVEAAGIAGCPVGTLSYRASRGLDRLRSRLTRQGAVLSAGALAGMLVSEASVALPESLLPSLLVIPGFVASGAGAASAGGNAAVLASEVVKAMFWTKMKMVTLAVCAVAAVGVGTPVTYRALAAGTAGSGKQPGAESPVPTGLNPFRGRRERVDVFEFAARPAVRKQGGPSTGPGQAKYVITFASRAACDATVAIVDSKGRIVRHLASGVLGANAPWPFKQGSLSQSIEWDGKDDYGRALPSEALREGGFRVRVGLGLKASYDRSLGWTPAKAMGHKGMAVDRYGRLFILDGSVGEGGGVCFSVKVYDREGRYLRQIAPPPANMAGKAGYIAWNKTNWGSRVPRMTLGFLGTTLTSDYMLGTCVVRQTPVVTRDGRFVMLSGQCRKHNWRVLLTIDGRDGKVAPNGLVTIDSEFKVLGKGQDGGPLHAALSPDDKWLYIGSPEGCARRHGVYRVDMTKPGKAKLFLGNAGKAEKHFNSPRGVACDGKGNIYVADKGNDRIQVFKPDGSFLKSLPVKKPNQLAVHRKTGEVYVLQLLSSRTMKLVKLGGLKDPAIKIKGPQLGCHHEGIRMHYSPVMALDDGGEKTYLWVKGYRNGISRYLDQGSALKRVRTGQVNGVVKGWERWEPWAHQCLIAADPVREELYIREEGTNFSGGMIRVDGRTGRVLDRCGRGAVGGNTPFGIENVAVAPSGRVYYRTGHKGEWLTCYDPETKQLAPLPGATWTSKQQGSIAYKGRPYRAIRIPASGGGRTFQDVMGVGLNGDLYIPCGIRRQDAPLLKAAGMEFPVDKEVFGPERGSLLKVFSAEGELRCLSALPGLGASSGICAGRAGEVYAALACQPLGAGLPEGMAPGAQVDPVSWGTVVKFDSRTGEFPVGRIGGRWTPSLGGAATHRWMVGRGGRQFSEVRIENVLWDYPGLGLVKGRGEASQKANLSMDGFERCFVPALHTCTVNVLDANGNIVVRIGGYGNADSRGKDSPIEDPETGELRPRRKGDPDDIKSPLAEPDIGFAHPNFTAVTDEALYVNDRANYRIVRARLGYHAEETVSVP